MEENRDLHDVDEALRHSRAGVKAIEAAQSSATATGSVYPTHLYLATVELAHAIELAMKVALRNQ
jgi:hypothetical protein